MTNLRQGPRGVYYTKQSLRGTCDYERLKPRNSENDLGARITEDDFSRFLNSCRKRGISERTLDDYGKKLKSFYDYLPDDKTIHFGTLEKWREALIEKGYANATINVFTSVINVYLDYIGRREYQLPNRLKASFEEEPELSRDEYLQMLETARKLNKERVYLLIKFFATVDANVQDLSDLTVEATRSGKMLVDRNRTKRIIYLPEVLRKELLSFAENEGIESGSIFLSRSGKPMSRTCVTRMIRSVCPAAEVLEDKGSPRCLQKLYRSTREKIESNIRYLADQEYDRLLEQELLELDQCDA